MTIEKRGGVYLEKEYEVIRLITQNASCHIVTDCVRGTMLPEYIERSEKLEKEKLFSYLHQMIKQLGYLQEVREVRTCCYSIPFCMIIKASGELVLLDINAKSNQYLVSQLGRENVRRCFFKTGDSYNTVFPIGKTIQYILAKANVVPKLTSREEYKLKKIISKCLSDNSKKQYQKISEILYDLPKLEKKREPKRKKGSWFFPIIFVSGVSFVIGGMNLILQRGKKEELPVKLEKEESVDFLEIGMMYFLEMENYKKSKEMFARSKDQEWLSKQYVELSDYMMGESERSEEEMEELLSEIEMEIEEEINGKRILFRVWSKMQTETALEQKIRFGKILLEEQSEWLEDDVEKKIENEIRTIMAEAYEKSGEKELALEQYKMIKEWNKSEEIYRSIIRIARTIDKREAILLCKEGIEANPLSKELRIQLIQTECEEKSVSKETCEASIKKMIQECPQLLKEESFHKLQNEYGIKVEGETVWVEK